MAAARAKGMVAALLLSAALYPNAQASERSALIEWDISNLSGAVELKGRPPIRSRHVLHPDNVRAADYLEERLTKMGWKPQREGFKVQPETIQAIDWRGEALRVLCRDRQYRWTGSEWAPDDSHPRLAPEGTETTDVALPSAVRSEKPNRRIVRYAKHPQRGWVALAHTGYRRWGIRWETLWFEEDGTLRRAGRIPNKTFLRRIAISQAGWAVAGDWGSVLVSEDEGKSWHWLPPPGQGKPSSNIIFEWPGKSDEKILLVAHFDSTAGADRGYRPEIDPAPGADDNASSVSILLDLAEWAAQQRDRGARPNRTIRWAFANAEEIGLVGSFYDAQRLVESGAEIAWVLNLDQVGSSPGDDRKLWVFHSEATQTLAWRLEELGYRVPADGLALSPYPVDRHALSDHYAYAARGIQTLYLTGGAPAGPHYHRAGDTVQRVDLSMTADLSDCLKVFLANETGLPAHIWPIEAGRSSTGAEGGRWRLLAWTLPLGLALFYAMRAIRLR